MAKIGILSFAHVHAPSYASCLTELSEAELAAVWDDNARRGRAAAKAHGARFIGDLDAFLATDIAGVVITAENVRHRELVERAAAAGKWILCEKPLATTVQDAKAMIAACKKAKVGLGHGVSVSLYSGGCGGKGADFGGSVRRYHRGHLHE